MPFEALHEVQDRAIREAVAMQERLGLPIVSDGEFRRGGWSRGFLNAVDGFEFRASKLTFRNDQGVSTASPAPVATQTDPAQAADRHRRFQVHQVSGEKPRQGDDADALPHAFRPVQGRRSTARSIPTIEKYWDDMIAVFQQEMQELYAAGCRYLQLDEVPLALLCDKNIRALASSEGDDPDKLVALYIDVLNRAVAGRPADLTIGMHLCRGNMEGLWMGDGGYAPIAEALFNRCDVDAFLLEYDSPRAGDFAPLRHVPAGQARLSRHHQHQKSRSRNGRRADAAHRRSAEICADGPARHLPAMRIFQRRDVEVCDAAEQGDGRYPDAEDPAAGRSRPTRVGACLKQSPRTRRSSGELRPVHRRGGTGPISLLPEHARARSGALVGDRAGVVLHPLSKMCSNCRTVPT